MSPTLNGSSTLERFKRSNASKIRNGIMFNFYPGLPQYVLTDVAENDTVVQISPTDILL